MLTWRDCLDAFKSACESYSYDKETKKVWKWIETVTVTLLLFIICHKIQITIKQNSYTKANETGKEAQTMRLIDIGHPQSKSEVK